MILPSFLAFTARLWPAAHAGGQVTLLHAGNLTDGLPDAGTLYVQGQVG